MDLYGGPEIFNTVTWPLDGTAEKVKRRHLFSTGHIRLFNFVKGQILDVSSIMGPDMFVFTTAASGTLHWKVTFGEHFVILNIDATEGWVYSIENEHSCFEFFHKYLPYMSHHSHWSMIQDCLPDYSKGGLCPNGHEATELGIPAARRACITLSRYKGELPTPCEVRHACATLITYGPEAYKSNEVLDLTSETLNDEKKEYTLGKIHPFLSRRIKRWRSLGESKLDYLVRKLMTPEEGIFPVIPTKTGIETTQGVLDSVCVLPFNSLLPKKADKRRFWTAEPLDQGCEVAMGKPHFLSPQFSQPWPFNSKLAVLRPPNTFIDASAVLPHTKVRKRKFGSTVFRSSRTFSSSVQAALQIVKSLVK